jgi:hypothetical protein
MVELAEPAILVRKKHRPFSAHYWVTLGMAAALAPVLHIAGLPLRFAWTEFFRVYWGFLVAEAVIGGIILYMAGSPLKDSIGPLVRRYSRQKLRFAFIVPLIPVLMLTLGIRVGLVVSIATVVMLEIKDRAEENHIGLLHIAADIFWPTMYLFAAAIVISSYNDAIAALRYNGAAELTLKHWDSVLLGGHSVSGIAHAFIGRSPRSIPWMEFVYFGTFAQTGGCIALLALTEGRPRAMQYVGTILFAFYFALVCFYLWPATGPYASCISHFSDVPNGTIIYPLQRFVVTALERFRSGASLAAIGPDYYIALPSMHFAQALISIWFLRRWKRLLVLLIVFDALLVPSILLLENHYLVDLIVALPVAVVAIHLTHREASSADIKLETAFNPSTSA